jgi:hypothetical protein
MATFTVTVGAVHVPITYTAPVTGYPDASTTGARGTLTTYAGPATITTAGATFTNMLFPSGIVVTANNVSFRNCKFTDQGSWPLFFHEPTTGAMVDHCTFITGPQGECSVQICEGTVQYCDVSGSSDGIRGVDNCVIQHNYVHDIYHDSTTHSDGIDIEGSVGNNIIQHNTVLVESGTSAICSQRWSGTAPYKDVLIDNNLVAGGNYCIYGPGGASNTTKIRITNNRMSNKYGAKYGYYGWLAYEPGSGNGNVISGNVDYQTGAPVT